MSSARLFATGCCWRAIDTIQKQKSLSSEAKKSLIDRKMRYKGFIKSAE
jgi:hypothetical protein